MARRNRPEIRFVVSDSIGRRSSVWRVIVGGNQVYLSADSLFGQVKISLHSDGYCQQGYTEKVRSVLPPGKGRAALDRWRQPKGQPGVLQPAYMLYFTGSQLLHQEKGLPPDTVIVPSSAEDREVKVGLFFVEPPLPELDDVSPLNHLVRLPLRSGAAVDLLWCEVPRAVGRVEAVKHMYLNTPSRELPVLLSEEKDYGYGFGGRPNDGSRWVGLRQAIEVAVEPSREVLLVSWTNLRVNQDRYEVNGDSAMADELTVLKRRFVRLQPDYRDWVERGGQPVYVQDNLVEVVIRQAAPLDERDKNEVVREVFQAGMTEADLVVRRQGGVSLMATQTVFLSPGLVIGFCILVRPICVWRGRATSLRSAPGRRRSSPRGRKARSSATDRERNQSASDPMGGN